MATLREGNPGGTRVSTTVAIVGGGLGGLACALRLQSEGIACVVFERDPSLDARKAGYGMTLSSDTRGPLAALGILEACRALDCPSEAHWVFDGSGRVRSRADDVPCV